MIPYENRPKRKLSQRRPLIINDDNNKNLRIDCQQDAEYQSESELEDSDDGSYEPSLKTESDYELTNKKTSNHFSIEWFVGPGWIVGTIDVTFELMEFRNSCIASKSQLKETNVSNFVKNRSSGIHEYFDKAIWEDIFNNIRSEIEYLELSEHDVIANKNFNEFMPCIREWQKTMKNNEHDLVLEFFESIHNSLSVDTDKNIKEDSFVHKALESVLKAFYQDTANIKLKWSTDVLEASAHRKKKFDPSLRGRIPDFSVSYSYKNRKVDLLVVEVKPPNKVFADLVKLGNELKDVLDKAAEDGICCNNLRVCGLLVEGFQCSFYIMDLKYEAVYRIIHVGKFFLPCNFYNLDTAPTTIEIMMQMKHIFTQSAKIIHKDLS
ncbi:9470_t:CDS:10, partial [Entrophospora sp. SA101]